MNKKEICKIISDENWEKFCKFMSGQTVSFKNGEVDFYECDVQNFINKMKGRPTFFD
ncbi:MAG: hypothetical protein ACREBJ_10190 [Nitrosotalea sp.]